MTWWLAPEYSTRIVRGMTTHRREPSTTDKSRGNVDSESTVDRFPMRVPSTQDSRRGKALFEQRHKARLLEMSITRQCR
jgi:hypothetical protein